MANLTITPADVLPSTSAIFVSGPSYVAGEDIDAGEFIYRKTSDGLYYLADNSTAEKSTVIGVAAANSAQGQRLIIIIQDDTCDVNGAATQGRVYALSDTPGKIREVSEIATTADIFLIPVAQGGASGTSISFRFNAPRAGVQND